MDQWFKSVLFWVVAVGLTFYVIYHYLRDHPQTWQALLKFKPLRALVNLWIVLWRRFDKWGKAARNRLSGSDAGQRANAASTRTLLQRFWPGARSPRERIFYYYLNTLRRARKKGFPRHASQTPNEYRDRLGPNLSQAEEEMTSLTQSFVHARYSRHPVDPSLANAARADWQRLKAELQTLKTKN